MRVLFLFLFAWFVGTGYLHAQKSETYTLKSGQSISKVFPKAIYRYPEFLPGTVLFKNGNRADSKLNYNMWLEEMQFIQPSGDTLSIDNEKTIANIIIGKDSFLYDKIYLELISGKGLAKLAGRQRIVIIGREKIGAYDQPTSTSAIDSYQYFTKSENQRLDIRENLILGKRMIFYIGDKFNHFVPASRKNILNLFSKYESDISEYLKQHNIDFYLEEDMLKLVAFLNSL